MGTPFFIARRYLFSKKKQNVINIISVVSIFGISISVAAMVIILSGFNGIERLVMDMFTSFESDIEITSRDTKTFNRSFLPNEIYEVEGITAYSASIEEIAIVKNGESFIIGTIKGVEDDFLQMCDMEEHLLDGFNRISDGYGPLALVGAGAIQNLNGYIYQLEGQYESYTIYSPNKQKKISGNKLKNIDAFTTSQIPVAGVFGYNNEVDENYMIVPLEYAREIFNYENEITQLELNFSEETDLEKKKEEIQELIGESFTVKTGFEQNQLIYETSQTEKWITILILGFIFFLATFNMIASITMLVIEKKDNMNTLYAMGAKKSQIGRIFFYEGILINAVGLIFGLLIGYGICFLQIEYGLLKMEQSTVPYFPVYIRWEDAITILSITIGIGTLAAFLPSKILIKRLIR